MKADKHPLSPTFPGRQTALAADRQPTDCSPWWGALGSWRQTSTHLARRSPGDTLIRLQTGSRQTVSLWQRAGVVIADKLPSPLALHTGDSSQHWPQTGEPTDLIPILSTPPGSQVD